MSLTYYVEGLMDPEDGGPPIPHPPVPYSNEPALTKHQVQYAAEDAAEDFWNNHDGWDSEWPLTFVVRDGDKELGRFEVEQAMEPYFIAYEAGA